VRLADVAGTRAQQGARTRCGRRGRQREAAGFVVDAIGGAGRGSGHHRTVGVGDLGPLLGPPRFLHRFEHGGGRPPDGDEIRVVVIEVVQFGENRQRHRQSVRVDADLR
jgi:hypothetical protein